MARMRRVKSGVAKVGSLAGRTAKVKAPRKPRPINPAPGAGMAGAAFGAQQIVQPVTPGSDVTYGKLDNLARSATEQKYGYADTALQGQYGTSAGMEQKIPQWFDYYRQQVQGLAAQDAEASKAAADQITGIGTTLAGATVNAASADQAAMMKDAAIRGATVNPDGYVRAIQAGNVNVSNLGTQAALQTTLGANQGSFWRGQENVSEQAKVQQLLSELAYRRGTLDPQRSQLAREKGAFGQTFRQDFTNDEATRVLNNRIADSDVFKTQAQLEQGAAGAKTADQQAELAFQEKHGVSRAAYRAMTPEQRAANDRSWKRQSNPVKPKPAPSPFADPPGNFTGSPADWNAMPRPQRDQWVKNHPTSKPAAGGEKDKFGNTPKQRRAANDSFTRARSLANSVKDGGKASDGRTIPPLNEQKLYETLLSENINAVVARAAAQMAKRGYVDPKVAAQLRRRGVTTGYTTKRPAKPQDTRPADPFGGVKPKGKAQVG